MNFRATLSASFRMEPAERSIAIVLFFYHLLMTAATVVGRTVGDTLFLSRFDASQLSFAYIAISVILSLSGLLYHRIVDRFEKKRLMYAVTGTMIASVLGIRLLLEWGLPGVDAAVYVVFELMNALMIIQFWTFTNDRVDARQARRLLGFIGAAGIVGGMASGFTIRAVVPHVGTSNLLFVYAALMVACMFLVAAFPATPGNRPAVNAKQRRADKLAGKKKPVSTYHVRLVAVIVGAIAMVLILIDYQFKSILQSNFQEEELAAFLGDFYVIAGACALVIQLFGTNRILARFGILITLLILPLVLALGSAVLFAVPVLLWATVLKAGDKVFSDTVFVSTGQLMYVPIAAEVRGRAKVLVDGIVKPVSKGLAALILIVFAAWLPVRYFSLLVLGLLSVCVIAIVLLKKEYVKALVSTLKTGRLDLRDIDIDLSDASAVEILTEGMRSEDEKQVLYCIETLKGIESYDPASQAAFLLDHRSPQVRAEAVRIMEPLKRPEARSRMLHLIEDEDPAVRHHAVLGLACYGDETALKTIRPFLKSTDLGLRSAAIAGLMKYYGIDGIFYSVDAFKGMVSSELVEERREAATILGIVGVHHFYQPLVNLLADEDLGVRLRALESAEHITVGALIPHIIETLKHRDTRHQAIRALSCYRAGDILPTLRLCLSASGEQDGVAASIPRVCETIGTREAIELMFDAYPKAVPYIRGKILEALAKTRTDEGEAGIAGRDVRSLLALECTIYDDCRSLCETVGGCSGTDVLLDALRDRMRLAGDRIFRLLGLLYDPSIMDAVRRSLVEDDGRRRANALEVLDNLLEDPLRRTVTDLFGRPPVIGRETDAQTLFEAVGALLESEEPWIRMCVAYLSEIRVLDSVDPARASQVREAARGKVHETYPGETVDTVRKVATLHRVPLFSDIPGAYVASIARQLDSLSYRPGDVIVKEGDIGDSFYVVLSGEAAVSVRDEDIDTIREGECFGEMAVLDRERRSATVRAVSNLRVFRLESDTFYDLIAERIEIAKGVIRMLCTRLRNRLSDLEKRPAPVSESMAEEPEMPALPMLSRQGDGVLLKRVLVLRGIDLFFGLAREDLFLLASLVEEQFFRRGEIIVREGEPGDALYGIVEGTVSVRKAGTEVEALESGESFGEMALLDGEPRSATVVALKDTTVLSLSQDDFYALLFDKIEITRPIFRELVQRLRRFTDIHAAEV